MHLRISFALIILAFSLSAPDWLVSSAWGETAYRWVDESGRVVFGTKPPSGARELAPVRAKNYSRYRPSRLLTNRVNRSRGEGRAKYSPAVDEQTLITPPEEKPEPPKAGRRALPLRPVLTSEPVSLKFGEEKEIISCLTTVKNRTGIDVDGIQVSFEFSDGTLIPADGPTRLNASTGAVYSVREENLPIKLSAGSSNAVKVLINTDADSVSASGTGAEQE